MNPVAITFRYLPGEYRRAFNAHQCIRMRIGPDSVFSLVVLVGGLAALYFGGEKYFWLGITFAAVGLAYPVLSAVMLFVLPRLMISDSARLLGEYQLTFSHDGIRMRTESVDSRIDWSLYKRATVVRDFYLLYWGRHEFTAIPKRAFESAADIQAFDALLLAHVPKVERSPSQRVTA
jgi:hypothetical protein